MYLYRTWANALFNGISRFRASFLKWAGLRALALLPGLLAGAPAAVAQTQVPSPSEAASKAAPAGSASATTIIPYVDDSSTVRVGLPGAQLAGSAKLTVWGFDIYRASLWVVPGFRQSTYSQHAFALELAYLRKFDASAITQRTLDEMQRQTRVPPEKARAWRDAMMAIFPDVKPGDRITGIHQPGAGTRFLVNGKLKGEIVDADFDRLFFGIWLSDATSEPALRQALLAQTAR